MPYKASQGSMATIARLRDLLGGGTGAKQDNPIAQILADATMTNPAPATGQKPTSPSGGYLTNFFTNAGPTLTAGLQHAITDPNQATPQDPLEAFLMGMAGDLNGTGTGFNQADYEQALKNSSAQLKKAFGAEIGAVKASSAAARHQTKRSKKQIKAMYNALSKQYDQGAAQEVAQGQQIANALQGVANNTAGQLQGSSDKIIADEAALAKSLGVAAAAPTVTAQQGADTAKQVGDIQQFGGREAGMQMENSGSQQRFLKRSGLNALLEGTNKRADLVGQLQAFLQQNMGKIADIQGQQGQALAANQMSAAKQFTGATNDASQQKWQREKDLATLMMSLKGQNTSAAANQAKSQSYADQQQNDTLVKLLSLLNNTTAAKTDPKTAKEIYDLIQGALQAQAGN